MAVNGAPERAGTPATLLKKVLEGAAAAGAEVEMVHLYDLDFKGCTSCFACKRIGGKKLWQVCHEGSTHSDTG